MKLIYRILFLVFFSFLFVSIFFISFPSTAKAQATPGTCACEWAGMPGPSTSCVLGSNPVSNCIAGFVPSCYQETVGGSNFCNCQCVTPTPTPGPGNCSCTQVSGVCQPLQGPGYCNQSAGYIPKCSTFGSSCSCICVIPTPTVYPSAWSECNTRCTDPAYPVGNCTNTGGNPDTTRCARPPAPNQAYDCQLGGGATADCFCCVTQLVDIYPLTPKEALSPRCGTDSINTAIGCLPVGDKNAFLAFILRWAIGISGGVSFLLIIYSSFMIMTAAGDKRKLQSVKELLTAALS